jgi:hypothetical protein
MVLEEASGAKWGSEVPERDLQSGIENVVVRLRLQFFPSFAVIYDEEEKKN